MATSFWADPVLEPKRQYRFRLLLKNNNAYTIKSVTNPTVAISSTPHKFLNHTFYYPGRAEWQPIDVTFVDPQNPDQTAKLYAKLRAMGYRSPTSDAKALFGFTKKQATDTLGSVRIQTLGPKEGGGSALAGGQGDLDVIGEWKLWNPFFTNISWGNFSYDSEDLIELSTTIQYDYAEYSGKGAAEELTTGINQD